MPAETTITTQDGVAVHQGDRVFNYYDHMPAVIVRIDDHAQPDTMKGQDSSTQIAEWSNYWFTVQHDDGSRTSLDGSRICSVEYARRKGWMT